MLLFFREYSKQLQNYSQQSQTLLTEVNKALELLEEMCDKHQSVSMKTGALYEACEKLVEDQVHACVRTYLHFMLHWKILVQLVSCLGK